MIEPGWLASLIAIGDWAIRLGLCCRVIMRRRPVGVTLAWIAVINSAPYFGAIVYLLFGELRLGRDRSRRALAIHPVYQEWLHRLPSRYPIAFVDPARETRLATMIERGLDVPPLPGNAIALLDDTDAIFSRMVQDIDTARSHCHLEFYIWSAGGRTDLVVEALVRARSRGATCRVLLDAIGSKSFFPTSAAARLRQAGVDLRPALRAQPWRFLFERLDLRLHRKIVVIDGQVAFTGSMNLVDPRFFKQTAGVGEWVDAMVRLEGPAVEALGATFLEDWELETGERLLESKAARGTALVEKRGPATVQVLPSGPTSRPQSMKAILLQTIYEAQTELVLTTPYFVPDEAMVMALASAALRGVAVRLVLPACNDSMLVDLASQAFKGDLASSGVHIHLFEGGLLHTKSITADRRKSLFGSLNLDPRSLDLNFEITLVVYNAEFTVELRALQQSYIDASRDFDLETWRLRPVGVRFAENLARLAGPLL